MISGVIGRVVEAADEGEITVSAEIQPEPEDGTGPWAVVSIRLPASQEAGLQALELAMALEDDSSVSSADLLPIRTLAQSLGGDLWLDGPESERPRLMLSFPLLATQRGEGDIRSIVGSHLGQDPDNIETLLILVEDPERLEMMSEELSEEGYRVVATSEGREVLALAREQSPDLILLDMLSRDPEALEVAMVLKQDHRTLNTPVLFLTSMNDPREEKERLGAASFLVRPTGTAALVSTIQGVLGAGVSPAGRVLVVEQDDAARETLVMMIQAGASTSGAAGIDDLESRLTRLKSIYEKGLITEEEYKLKRQEIMESL